MTRLATLWNSKLVDMMICLLHFVVGPVVRPSLIVAATQIGNSLEDSCNLLPDLSKEECIPFKMSSTESKRERQDWPRHDSLWGAGCKGCKHCKHCKYRSFHKQFAPSLTALGRIPDRPVKSSAAQCESHARRSPSFGIRQSPSSVVVAQVVL